MLIRELRGYIKNLPDDADVVILKNVTEKDIIVASALSLRTAERLFKGTSKLRLVIENKVPIKER